LLLTDLADAQAVTRALATSRSLRGACGEYARAVNQALSDLSATLMAAMEH
jgi:hypothetical protein